MLCRPWFLSAVLSLLPALVLSSQAAEKQPPPRVAAEIADMEFELKKLELELQMAEFGVKEAELALDRVDLQRLRAQATNEKHEMGRLHVDRQEAELHIEMRKLAKQAASLMLEQAHARVKRLKESSRLKPAPEVGKVYLRDADGVLLPAEEAAEKRKEADAAALSPADVRASLDGSVQVELLEDDVFVTRGKTEDVKRVVALIEELESKVKTEQPVDKKQAAVIEKLIEQRRDVLQSMVDAVVAEFRAGKAVHADVVRATESMIAAELELTTDKAKRVALHERRLKGLKELEDLAKAKHEMGRAEIAEVFAAKDARIKAEIELLRERAGTE